MTDHMHDAAQPEQQTDWFDECSKQAGKAFHYWLALEKDEQRFRELGYVDWADELRTIMSAQPPAAPVETTRLDVAKAIDPGAAWGMVVERDSPANDRILQALAKADAALAVSHSSAGNEDDIVAELRDLKPETPVLTILDRCIRSADEIDRLRSKLKLSDNLLDGLTAVVEGLKAELAEADTWTEPQTVIGSATLRAAAQALVHEIGESGTHTRWKRLANAIATENERTGARATVSETQFQAALRKICERTNDPVARSIAGEALEIAEQAEMGGADD